MYLWKQEALKACRLDGGLERVPGAGLGRKSSEYVDSEGTWFCVKKASESLLPGQGYMVAKEQYSELMVAVGNGCSFLYQHRPPTESTRHRKPFSSLDSLQCTLLRRFVILLPLQHRYLKEFLCVSLSIYSKEYTRAERQ